MQRVPFFEILGRPFSPMTLLLPQRNQLELELEETGVTIKETQYPDEAQEVFIAHDRLSDVIEYLTECLATLNKAEAAGK